MPDSEGHNGLASVDVGVALLAAVLAIFAMIEFAPPTPAPQHDLPTIGALEETVPAIPPGWAAVQPRTVLTLLYGTELTVLDMGHIAASASDLSLRLVDHPTANMRFNEGRRNGPVKTELTLTFDIRSVPASWVRWRRKLDPSASCEELRLGLLGSRAGGVVSLIVVAAHETDVGAAMGLMSACGLQTRISLLPEPKAEGRVVLTVGVSQGVFALEIMLR